MFRASIFVMSSIAVHGRDQVFASSTVKRYFIVSGPVRVNRSIRCKWSPVSVVGYFEK